MKSSFHKLDFTFFVESGIVLRTYRYRFFLDKILIFKRIHDIFFINAEKYDLYFVSFFLVKRPYIKKSIKFF